MITLIIGLVGLFIVVIVGALLVGLGALIIPLLAKILVIVLAIRIFKKIFGKK